MAQYVNEIYKKVEMLPFKKMLSIAPKLITISLPNSHNVLKILYRYN